MVKIGVADIYFQVDPSGQNLPNLAHPFPVLWQPRISDLVLIAFSLMRYQTVYIFIASYRMCLLIFCAFFDRAKILLITLDQAPEVHWRVYIPSFTQIGQNPKEEFEKVGFPVVAI